MIIKTKLLPQTENSKKIEFKNFIVPSATLSVMNVPFCSDQGDKLLSFWRQVGVKLVSSWPANSPNNNPIKLSQRQMQKLQLWLHVQAQENRSQGEEERYTI